MKRHLLDRVGVILSVICGLHCILTPIVLIFSPWLARYCANEYFHIAWFIVTAVVMASVMVRQNKNSEIIKFGVSGLILLLLGIAAHFAEGDHGHHEEHLHLLEIIPTILGGALLLTAHLKNIRDCACQSKKEATASL